MDFSHMPHPQIQYRSSIMSMPATWLGWWRAATKGRLQAIIYPAVVRAPRHQPERWSRGRTRVRPALGRRR